MRNLNRLKKEEIIKRHFWKCVHGHTGLEHPKCYEQENHIGEKIGILDIETSELTAPWGIVLSYCIKKLDGEILGRCLTSEELEILDSDKQIIQECVNDMRKFDKLVVYYGGDYRFDIPFLRSRAIQRKYNIKFPEYKEIKILDLYPI